MVLGFKLSPAVFGVILILPMLSQASVDDDSVGVSVSTTLQSRGFSEKYRPELAFSGSAHSSFLSQRPPRPTDDFTVVFERPVHVSRISIQTGDEKYENQLIAGILEVSEDGTKFSKVGTFSDGSIATLLDGDPICAVRIQPTSRQDNPLAIHNFVIKSDEQLGRISRIPRIVFDSSQATDLTEWGDKALRVARDSYPMVSKALASKDFMGPNYVRIWFNPNYRGVAATSNDTIEIAPAYVRTHMTDFGMVVHELTHTIQHYTRNTNAGWLVEGVADYVRFYLYEPNVPRPKIDPAKAKYTDAYRTTAAFLAYGQQKYDRHLVQKLNKALREGTYKPDLFKEYTGKEPTEIWSELIADLQAGKTKLARL